MQTSWSGFHYDGRTAHREPVTIIVTGGGLHVTRDDGDAFLWSFAELRRVTPLGNEALRIERKAEPVETLTVTEPGLPEAAPALGKSRAAFDAAARSTFGRVVAGAIVVAVIYFFGLPALAGVVAPHVPLAWEEQLGSGMVQQMVPADARCHDSLGQAVVEEIVARLVSVVPGSPYRFRVTLADDSIINAFAAPGGYVVVNRGLLEATRTPEELAGVLAHEIQHVVNHHATRAMIREIPLQVAASAISGGGNALGALASRAVGTLGVLRYHRGDELEADRDGVRMLQTARVDTKGMIDFFRTLSLQDAGQPRAVAYLSTHPQTADRISELRRLASEASYTPVPLPGAGSWDIVKAACRR